MNEIEKRLRRPSKASYQDRTGQLVSYLAIGLICLLVVGILYFIASRGLSMFLRHDVSWWGFLTGVDWNPGHVDAQGNQSIGALAMIVTSFSVTVFAALLATPFAVAIALFITEYSRKAGRVVLQTVIELLVGIPSVVYGFVGLSIVVPLIRHLFGGTGFGILAGALVLFVMILPTITSLCIDSLKSVPVHYRQASLALGATQWQTIHRVILKAARPGILTAIVFGMARAFGEALAVQMVIGNALLLPHSLVSPASTLTSQLTTGIGNTVFGTLQNDALWSLALLLLVMALLFNIVVRFIGRQPKGDLR